MKQSNNWDDEIREIEKFFSTHETPGRVRLNSWSLIVNVDLFLSSHLCMVKHHNGNKVYLPYLERLFELKKIIENGNRK